METDHHNHSTLDMFYLVRIGAGINRYDQMDGDFPCLLLAGLSSPFAAETALSWSSI
jgi:hypothetical protein